MGAEYLVNMTEKFRAFRPVLTGLVVVAPRRHYIAPRNHRAQTAQDINDEQRFDSQPGSDSID